MVRLFIGNSKYMKSIYAFLNLVRWQNLAVVILTQTLLHFMIIKKLATEASIELPLSYLQFAMLVLSTVLIAAAGNIFNDLADLKTDNVNKPQKVIIGHFIKAKTATVWAWFFNGAGFVLAIILALQLELIQLAIIQLMVILLLKRYSISFKNQLLVGNLLIALFTALSVFIVYLYNLLSIINNPIILAALQKQLPFIFTLTQAYVLFAFLSNLIREITKDIEDINGDKAFDIHTFPVVYGINKSTILVRFLNAILATGILIFALYSFKMEWHYLAIYLLVAVLIPVVFFELNAQKAKEKDDFHSLSSLSKIIMLAGILSMQVFSLQF